MIEKLALGAAVALQPFSLLMVLLGVAWGIVGGALPGITGSIAMALLLPLTFGMEPAVALMMLVGVYIGSMFGGSIPAILIRAPGTPGAAVTVLDGYELHRKGESGKALGMSLIASTTGGILSVVILVALAVPLSKFALAFGPPEYFALGVLGLALISSFAARDLTKGAISATLGLMLATVGTDPFSGTPRFALGTTDLLTGVNIVTGMIGLFAVSEIFSPDRRVGRMDGDSREVQHPSSSMGRALEVACRDAHRNCGGRRGWDAPRSGRRRGGFHFL